MTWWCELAWLGGPSATPGVLLCSGPDGSFSSVSPGVARPPSDVVVLPGLTLPGLVNAHSHAFHRALRGRSQHEAHGGWFWTWREGMYRLAGRLDPDTYRELATAVYAEMALSGITTVGEFHYLHHDPDGRPYADDAMGAALIDAAATVGVRLTLLDTCYLAGGPGVPLSGVQRRFSDGTADGWASRVSLLPSGPTVRVGAAIHSVRAVPPPAMASVVSWARSMDTPLHAHVSEQPAENEACQAAYGHSPTRVLADAGALDARFTAVHATHLTVDDIGLLGGSGSAACICPTTERDLADGIGPTAALAAAGARLCLGSDSHAVIDLWEEARAVELDERLATGQRGTHKAEDLLTAATSAGATALGWDGGGCLAVGAPADFCTLSLDGPSMAGTLPASGEGGAAAAVFAAGAGDVRTVVVGGRPVVTDGVHVALGPIGPRLAAAISRAWAES